MDLVDPTADLKSQNERLRKISEALMRRVEQSPDQSGMAYAQFERAALLEEQVRERTQDLERTLDLLHESNARFALAQKEAEDARAYLADAIETIDEGFALFDQSEKLVLYNSRFCRDLGSVRSALETGLSFDSYIDLVSRSDSLAWKDPETPESWRKDRLKLHTEDHVFFNIRLTGNRWMQVSEQRTNTGGTVILQMDVTEIMRLEREERDKLVNRQAVMLRATLNHLRQGVCIFDRDSNLVDWNRGVDGLLQTVAGEKLRGTSFQELLSRIDSMFLFSGDVSRGDLATWAAKRDGRGALGFEVRRSDGAIFDVFAQEMPDGGFVISFTDITQERAIADDLRELNDTLERRVEDRTIELGAALEDARRANASKTRFVAAASHDLLQPMSAAKLYASVLEDRMQASSDRELVQKTRSALESVESIITALMDISKLELGLATFEEERVGVDRIFDRLANEFKPRARAQDMDLRFVPSSLHGLSDPSYLYRIVQNLVSNALRYSTGDKVLVGARRRGNQVRIEVHDQGPGISQSDQAMVFQEFTQLNAAAAHQDSLGLGLAIVKRACAMLGHEVSVTSEPGRGSCFAVSLTCVDAPGQMDSNPVPQTPTGAPVRDILVGLVENDEALANSIAMTIESLGSSVLHAASGEAALALFDELGIAPDCLLIDYQLGDGMTGLDLIPKMRATFGADVPIAVISADRSRALQTGCEKLGVDLYHKPLSPDVLVKVLSGATRIDYRR